MHWYFLVKENPTSTLYTWQRGTGRIYLAILLSVKTNNQLEMTPDHCHLGIHGKLLTVSLLN